MKQNGVGRSRGQRVNWLGRSRPFPVLIITSLIPAVLKEVARLMPPALELRLDRLRSVSVIRLKQQAVRWRRQGCELLITARRTADGGGWPAAEEEARLATLAEFATLADAVDLELDLPDLAAVMRRIRRASGRHRLPIILSHHDLRRCPADKRLLNLLRQATRHQAVRCKIAVMTRRLREARAVTSLGFLGSAIPRVTSVCPLTVIAMGRMGAPTRWLLPAVLGGPSYAPLSGAVAPGQMPYEVLVNLMNCMAKGMARRRKAGR